MPRRGKVSRRRRTHLGPSVGSHGWNGYGRARRNDPVEEMAVLLMLQRFGAPRWTLDVETAAYQAIDD